MPKYLIERIIPGADRMSPRDLQALSQKSVRVLSRLGPDIQWVHSYVTGTHIYCVYIAPSEDLIREHGLEGGFPVTRIDEIRAVIDPVTAETSTRTVGQ